MLRGPSWLSAFSVVNPCLLSGDASQLWPCRSINDLTSSCATLTNLNGRPRLDPPPTRPAPPRRRPASPPASRAPCSCAAPTRGRRTQGAACVRRQRQHTLDRRGQRGGVAGRHAQPGDLVLDRLHRAAEIGGDHRARHRLRLDHHAAERLGLGRGVHHHVRQLQRRRHVVALADQAHPVGDAQRLRLAHQRGGVATAALVGADQHGNRVAARQPGQRRDQHPWPFQDVSRPGSTTVGAPSGSRQARASRASRSAETASGSKPPDRRRAGSPGCAPPARRAAP